MRRLPLLRSSILAGGVALLAASCDDDSKGLPSNAKDFVANYATIAHASYQDSRTQIAALNAALDALVATPNETTLAAARTAWVNARQPYLQTEAYRFYGGPIDDVDDFLNAWPLDEVNIDYVVDPDHAGQFLNGGYVNDTEFAITGTALESGNMAGGEADVTVGWHAIEFLLWGQDLSDAGPGARPATDYDTGVDGTAMNQDRRGLALTTLGDLLEGHLADLEATWAEGGDYRPGFVAQANVEDSLRDILTGLAVFSGNELGGERLAAINSHDQEDEHSCFSDTTRQDFIFDAKGVQNVYLGRYTRIDGTTVVSGVSLYDVVHEVSPTVADALRDRIATSIALADALMDPYDQEIRADNAAGTARLAALQDSLHQQQLLLNEAAAQLGLGELPSE